MNKWHSYHYNAVHYPKRIQPGNIFNPAYAGGAANFHSDLYHNGHYHKGMYHNGKLLWRRYDTVFHRGLKYNNGFTIDIPDDDDIEMLYKDDTISGKTFGLFTLLDDGDISDYDRFIESSQSKEYSFTNAVNDSYVIYSRRDDSEYWDVKRNVVDTKVYDNQRVAEFVEQTTYFVDRQYIGPLPVERLGFPVVRSDVNLSVRQFGYIASGSHISCLFEIKSGYMGGLIASYGNDFELRVSDKKTLTLKTSTISEYVAGQKTLVDKDWEMFWCDLGTVSVRIKEIITHVTEYEWSYRVKGIYFNGIYDKYAEDWIPAPLRDFVNIEHQDRKEYTTWAMARPEYSYDKELPKGIVEILAKYLI